MLTSVKMLLVSVYNLKDLFSTAMR